MNEIKQPVPVQRDIILFSTAEWEHPFWTNKQHTARELARLGNRVLYIDTPGSRRPSFSRRDLRRMAKRLRQAQQAPRQVASCLWVWSPLAIPFQRFRLFRHFNRLYFPRALNLALRQTGLRRQVLWTYHPLTTLYLRLQDFEKVVYHCVDEMKAQPGMPAQLIENHEKELVRQAHLVFTTTLGLTESRRAINPRTYYFPNVADFDHFAQALDECTSIPADLLRIPPPRLGFVGAISAYKVDFNLLRSLAQARPDWSLVLIGEVGEGDPWSDPRPLQGIPNLHLLGARPYADLPAYLRGIDVAILPSARNEYTEHMFPMKFFEYLAAGKPVVSIDLPALREYRQYVYLAQDEIEFVQGVAEALQGRAPDLESRLELARQHTYARRTRQMLELLDVE